MPNPIKAKAEVISLAQYGPGTYLVRLAPKTSVPRHKPGQFLHLSVDEYDPAGGYWPESRVFSIASAPGAPFLEIVYSVKGKYTRLMEESLSPGREVWIKLPFGDFIIDTAVREGQDVVLIAGGTGLSPFLPYLEKILAAGAGPGKLRLYYGIRENSMLLARELLARCVELDLAEVSLFVENESPSRDQSQGLKAEPGRLDIERIGEESRGLNDPVFFLSGPPGMIQHFKQRLADQGVEASHIKLDEWE